MAQNVLFSSVASLVGAQGQASYVAANAGLDAHANAQTNAGAPRCAWCLIKRYKSIINGATRCSC